MQIPPQAGWTRNAYFHALVLRPANLCYLAENRAGGMGERSETPGTFVGRAGPDSFWEVKGAKESRKQTQGCQKKQETAWFCTRKSHGFPYPHTQPHGDLQSTSWRLGDSAAPPLNLLARYHSPHLFPTLFPVKWSLSLTRESLFPGLGWSFNWWGAWRTAACRSRTPKQKPGTEWVPVSQHWGVGQGVWPV